MAAYRDHIPEPRERDDEIERLARQRAENLRRHRAHLRNPDPRDPDYEGAGEARDE